MKFTSILETVSNVYSRVKVTGWRNPKLSALDTGILKVALQLAALDGRILPEEYETLRDLALKCRGSQEKSLEDFLCNSATGSGILLAMAQIPDFTEESLLNMFTTTATHALPNGFESGKRSDIRRAFALWVAMAVSDGSFSGIEMKALKMLAEHFTDMRFEKDVAAAELRNAYAPTLSLLCGVNCAGEVAKRRPMLEPDFLVRAATIMRALANPKKREQAEADLAALIAG